MVIIHPGVRFGKLVVLKLSDVAQIKGKPKKWLCGCDCGDQRDIDASILLRGIATSCGCRIFNCMSLEGKRFNLLTVKKFIGHKIPSKKKIDSRMLCICDCGKEVITRAESLLYGRIGSCGCRRAGNGYKSMSGSYISSIQRGAECRNLSFNLSVEFIWDLFVRQKGLCALTGLNITFGKDQTASLDRIDSLLPYIESNVQWVHKDINRMKNKYHNSYYIDMCKLVTKNSKDLNAL